MAEDTILTATAASRAFSELLHRVCYGGEAFVIKKGNRFMARIAPVEGVQPESASFASAFVQESIEEPVPPPDATTADEAEFYRAWMEQVRKVELNDSPMDF